MAPCGSRATAAISSTVAGTEPVTPATMTGPDGGERVSRSASVRMARLRRDAGDSSFFSSRYAGQNAVMISRNLSVSFQCSEYSSGTKPASPSSGTFSVSTMSMSRASSAARCAACAGVLAPAAAACSPRCAVSLVSRRMVCDQRCTSMVSTRRRSISLTAGGRSSASVPSVPGLASPESSVRSSSPAEIGRICGSVMARPPDALRKASCMARVARRVGSSSVTSGSSSGLGGGTAGRRQVALQDRGGDGFQERPPGRDSEDACATGSAAAEAIRSAIKRRPHSRSTFPPRSRLPAFRRASTGHRGGCRTVVRCRSPCPTAD